MFFSSLFFLSLTLLFCFCYVLVFLKSASNWIQTTGLGLFDITYRKYYDNFDDLLISIWAILIAWEHWHAAKPISENLFVVKGKDILWDDSNTLDAGKLLIHIKKVQKCDNYTMSWSWAANCTLALSIFNIIMQLGRDTNRSGNRVTWKRIGSSGSKRAIK